MTLLDIKMQAAEVDGSKTSAYTGQRGWTWILCYIDVCFWQDDEAAERKKTDEPTPDDDAEDQEESSVADQDTEPQSLDDQAEPEPTTQQSNQSSPKKRTKADLEVNPVPLFWSMCCTVVLFVLIVRLT